MELVETCRLYPELHSCQSASPASPTIFSYQPNTQPLKIDGEEHVAACDGADNKSCLTGGKGK